MSFILRILFACLVVGLLLSWFNVDPKTVLTDAWAAVKSVWRLAGDVGGWAVPYVLTGAIIVIPVVALATLWRAMKGRGFHRTNRD